jgi:hypothetical protein
MLHRVALTALAFVLCTATALPAFDSATRPLDSYLRQIQLPDGAFADSNASNASHVTPYRAAYAAIGLATAGDAAPVLAFAKWYVAHMNGDDEWGPGCTIYDFTFTRNPYTIKPTKTGGAMDAPAGVFLTAMRYLYDTRDPKARAWVSTQEANAQCIARAAYGLYQPAYDCTQAITGYNFCLTEDNLEVWRGLGDVAWLEAGAWSNKAMETSYLHEQSSIGVGLTQMWDPKNQTYNWARSIVNGAFTKSSWWQFYPGAVTQLWPVIVGYARPDDPRSIELWRNFKAAWPFMPFRSPVFSPWPWTALAAAKMGDQRFVGAYVDSLNASYAAAGYPYGWESSDGGNMLTALVWFEAYSRQQPMGAKRRTFRSRCLACHVRPNALETVGYAWKSSQHI